jgi:hypothetical protein
MTMESAIALLSQARRDAEEMIPVLCQLATLAHLTGHYRNRDHSIESAAELIAHCGCLPRRSAVAISRLLS